MSRLAVLGPSLALGPIVRYAGPMPLVTTSQPSGITAALKRGLSRFRQVASSEEDDATCRCHPAYHDLGVHAPR